MQIKTTQNKDTHTPQTFRARFDTTYFGELLDWNQHFLAQLHVLVDDDIDELLLFLALIFLDFFNFYKRQEQRLGTRDRRFSRASYPTELAAGVGRSVTSWMEISDITTDKIPFLPIHHTWHSVFNYYFNLY